MPIQGFGEVEGRKTGTSFDHKLSSPPGNPPSLGQPRLLGGSNGLQQLFFIAAAQGSSVHFLSAKGRRGVHLKVSGYRAGVQPQHLVLSLTLPHKRDKSHCSEQRKAWSTTGSRRAMAGTVASGRALAVSKTGSGRMWQLPAQSVLIGICTVQSVEAEVPASKSPAGLSSSCKGHKCFETCHWTLLQQKQPWLCNEAVRGYSPNEAAAVVLSAGSEAGTHTCFKRSSLF